MRPVRRFLVLLTWLFWQGGFTFYAAVVVPIGTEVLGTPEKQGWITRRVTDYLNLAGLVAVVVLGWDLAVSGDPSVWRRRLRWAMWGLLTATLAALAWLHGRLVALINLAQRSIVDYSAFRLRHRWYLWLSTLQWFCGLASAWWMLRAWQAEDQSEAARQR
jgi:hypothetical protein